MEQMEAGKAFTAVLQGKTSRFDQIGLSAACRWLSVLVPLEGLHVVNVIGVQCLFLQFLVPAAGADEEREGQACWPSSAQQGTDP